MRYQAKVYMPFGMLGIRCSEVALLGIDFLDRSHDLQSPQGRLAGTVCELLQAYVDNPAVRFTVPIEPGGTPYQRKVWGALLEIPCGKSISYGELAAQLKSGAQAIGQACGANPIPIIVPCHRVVGRAGLGGFMRCRAGASLDTKRWLIAHEQS